MRILVTGATGFIGGRAAEYFTRAGHTVVATGRKPAREVQGVTWEIGTLEDADFCARITRGVDVVLHCAGKAGTWGEYAEFHRANVLVTENVLRAAEINGVTRFILLSSPSIYFDFKDQYNLSEEYLPPRPSNHYARTKLESEESVLRAHRPDFLTVALRPRFVIGAGDANVLPRMIALQEAGKLFDIGSGRNVVSVTSITNLLHAISLCLAAPAEAMGEVYNIADPKPLRFGQLVDEVLVAVGLPTERRRLSRELLMGIARVNEFFCRVLGVKSEPKLLPLPIGVLSQSMTLNIEKARTRLGYAPQDSTSAAILEFARWWNERGGRETTC